MHSNSPFQRKSKVYIPIFKNYLNHLKNHTKITTLELELGSEITVARMKKYLYSYLPFTYNFIFKIQKIFGINSNMMT